MHREGQAITHSPRDWLEGVGTKAGVGGGQAGCEDQLITLITALTWNQRGPLLGTQAGGWRPQALLPDSINPLALALAPCGLAHRQTTGRRKARCKFGGD